MSFLLPLIVAYLLGAIPFGLLISRLYKLPDIRKVGSGNIGATNVWRVGGPRPAIWVYILDIGKGILAVFLASLSNQILVEQPTFLVLAALMSVLGHIFPVYLGFRGGKGVNTALGALVALMPLQAAIALLAFLLTVVLTRYISLSSLVAATVLVLVTILKKYVLSVEIPDIYITLVITLALLVFFTHRQNIRRLLAGTESKFKFHVAGGAKRD